MTNAKKLTVSELEQELAASFGFTAEPDPKRGYGWCKFVKGDERVWACSTGWQNARVVNGYYTDHMANGLSLYSLYDALTFRIDNPMQDRL